jgi:hypothetical protein
MLVLGSAGSLAELLLIGHHDSTSQFLPLVLLGAGLVVGAICIVAPTAMRLRLLRALMLLFLLSGLVGVFLHFQGNREFELEMNPSAGGTTLLSKTLTGATPVLAPGSMSLLGAIGLAFAYRHPLLQSSGTANTEEA